MKILLNDLLRTRIGSRLRSMETGDLPQRFLLGEHRLSFKRRKGHKILLGVRGICNP